MTQKFWFSWGLFFLPFFASCLIKPAWIKSSCDSQDFVSRINSYTPKQLNLLLNQLEQDQNLEHDYCVDILKARIYLSQKNLSKAAMYFNNAAKKSPEFKDYFLLAQAKIQAENHKFKQSRAISEALLHSPAINISASFRQGVYQVLADIAQKQKDHSQIIKTHERLLASKIPETEALLFNLAVALNSLQEKEKANKVIKKLLINFPDSNSSQKILKTKNLASFALTLEENEHRLKNLIKRLAFNQIDKELATKSQDNKVSPAQKNQFSNYAIKSLMLNNKFEKGIARARNNALSPKATPQDLERYAWGLAKVDRFQDAADYYLLFMKSATKSNDIAKGCFFAGFSLYEASLYSLARLTWHACEDKIINSTYEENFYWYVALSNLLDHDYHKAQTFLKKLSQKFPKSENISKYLYFLSTTYKYLDNTNKSDFLFYQLAQTNKPEFYQLQARTQLGHAPILGKNISVKKFTKKAENIKDQQCQKALILHKLGFTNEAADLILGSQVPMTQKLALLQQIGKYHQAFERSYLIDPELSIIVSKLHASPSIRAHFPLPHKQTVDRMSQKYHVRKSLIYAIMREESAFFPHATSYRGAIGLMQMMPFVAHDLASKLNLDEFSQEHLKSPEIAIEFGTLLLATLQKQFSKPYLVIAAYNAGPHQVQKWLDRFGDLPAKFFIERIPFKQTRNYVKKVLLAESQYRALAGQKLTLWL